MNSHQIKLIESSYSNKIQNKNQIEIKNEKHVLQPMIKIFCILLSFCLFCFLCTTCYFLYLFFYYWPNESTNVDLNVIYSLCIQTILGLIVFAWCKYLLSFYKWNPAIFGITISGISLLISLFFAIIISSIILILVRGTRPLHLSNSFLLFSNKSKARF